MEIIKEYEDITKTKKDNVIHVTYNQDNVFKNFKDKEKFVKLIKEFGVSKSTMLFKINIVKLVSKYQNLMNLLSPLNFLNNYFKDIKEICKGLIVNLNR